jgi:hypothetical protein
LTVTTDALPQILDGIPLRLRTANVTVDRPGFIFNPSDCAQQAIVATISGAQGSQVKRSAPFAVSGCAGLSFGPKFTVTTSGRTSRRSGASLDARLVFPKGPQSNIARVKVDLPKQLPSRLTTLQHACPDSVFNANPAACPEASRIGAVMAITPILPVPLRGPVYFVSHGGAAFPNLVAILEGYGVRVDLIGDTFISKAGITSSTFTNVPDVPVSSFELFLPQGPHSALSATGNLCKSRLAMPTLFTAQDGAQLKQATPIHVTGCTNANTARKANSARKASRARKARTALAFPAPLVDTGAPSEVSQNQATISGTLDGQGLETTYEFDLGTGTGYGTRVFGDAGYYPGAQSFTLTLQGLAPGVTYHYRLQATNTTGTTIGADQTFTTSVFPSATLTGPASLPLVPIVLIAPTPTRSEPPPPRTKTKPKTKKHRNATRGKRSSAPGHHTTGGR